MITKLQDPSIDPDDPWSNDVLDLKGFGGTLSSMIVSVEQPFVISVKGEWGSGKSVFLRRLNADLELKSIPVVHVDAWKSDHYEDPIYSLISAVEARLEVHERANASTADEIKTISRSLFGSAAKVVAPLMKIAGAAADMVTGGAVGNLADGIGQLGEALLQANDEKVDAQEAFRASLIEARDVLLKRNDKSVPRPFSNEKIVILVDELDRCRPDYAIRLLERIKHFFDIKGIVFVIAVDGKNLHNAVNSLYGPSVESEVYLRKFFDIEMYLPRPSTKSFNFLLRRSFDVLQDERYAEADWEDAKRQFFSGNYSVELSSKMALLEASAYFEVVAEAFNLQLRDQAQAFARLNACTLALGTSRIFMPHAAALIVSLQFFDNASYERWRNSSVVPGSSHVANMDFMASIEKVNSRAGAVIGHYLSLCRASNTQEMSAHWDSRSSYDAAKSVALNKLPSDMDKALAVIKSSYRSVFAVTDMLEKKV